MKSPLPGSKESETLGGMELAQGFSFFSLFIVTSISGDKKAKTGEPGAMKVACLVRENED